jgi:hemerythrin-like metal-binding protein
MRLSTGSVAETKEAIVELVWTNGFSVGVPLMDEQHKRLIVLINATQDRCSKDTIKAMFDYADLHFKTEEKMLQERNYPGLGEQLNEHVRFLEHSNEFLSKNLSDAAICTELNRYLCVWLSHHILEIDMKYKHFLLPVKG